MLNDDGLIDIQSMIDYNLVLLAINDLLNMFRWGNANMMTTKKCENKSCMNDESCVDQFMTVIAILLLGKVGKTQFYCVICPDSIELQTSSLEGNYVVKHRLSNDIILRYVVVLFCINSYFLS
jgi:hypothetical protein